MAIYNKQAVRQEVLKKRASLLPEEVNSASDKIIKAILNDKNYQSAVVIGIYIPIKNEIDVTALLGDISKVFVAPKIVEDKMLFSIINENSQLIKGLFGIGEPKDLNEVNHIDYLIVPCVGIHNSYRLGFGGGYYDKYLSQNHVANVVGVIYDFQEVKFDIENHDQKLDYYFAASKEQIWIQQL